MVSGCPACKKNPDHFNRTTFVDRCKNKTNDPILYVIKCYNDLESFYKIGITSNSVKQRFVGKDAMPYKYDIIHEVSSTPENVYNIEKILHKLYKPFRYFPLISFQGQTECFNNIDDIMNEINLLLNR